MFAYANMPELRCLPPLAACVEWWVRWNRRCSKVADVMLRVEDLHTDWACAELGDVIGHEVAPMSRLPTDVNTRERADVHPHDVYVLLAGRHEQFGYA
jgi:hypothetical protein